MHAMAAARLGRAFVRQMVQRSELKTCKSKASLRSFSNSSYRSSFQSSSRKNPLSEQRILEASAKGYTYTFLLAILGTIGYYVATDTRSGVHQWLTPPVLRMLYDDAEDAHEIGTRALQTLHRLGLNPRDRSDIDGSGQLSVNIFGHNVANPIGISAGLDKGADVPDALFDIGPGIVEVGGITPLPQPGNEKPRVWRIPSQEAIINRYGLNSAGAEAVAEKLRQRVLIYAQLNGLPASERIVLDNEADIPPGSLTPGKLLAVQIAKNKTTPETDFEAVKRDYVTCVKHLGRYADIIVVNVSSPNTPGLRALQATEPLKAIMSGVVEAAAAVDRRTKPAVMVKVSPDQDSAEQIRDICAVVHASGVDGIIVGNTTTGRPAPLPEGFKLADKESRIMRQQGGYSGPQLFPKTLELVKAYRKELDSPAGDQQAEGGALSDKSLSVAKPEPQAAKVLFATGGVTNGHQARQLLDAGASVAMVYTALTYRGVGLVSKMKSELLSNTESKH